jgi:hypothetical protein
MPCKNKATRCRLQKLQKINKQKKKGDIEDNYGKLLSHPSYSQTPEPFLLHVAIFNEPDTLGEQAPDRLGVPASDEDDSDSGVEILDSGSDADIYEESELEKFSRILFTAQKRATELEAASGKKRRTHTGCSQSTVFRRKHLRDRLASQGYLPVHEFLKQVQSRKSVEELTHIRKKKLGAVTYIDLHKCITVETSPCFRKGGIFT